MKHVIPAAEVDGSSERRAFYKRGFKETLEGMSVTPFIELWPRFGWRNISIALIIPASTCFPGAIALIVSVDVLPVARV